MVAVRADTDDFQTFVDHGGPYAQGLIDQSREVSLARQTAEEALGSGASSDSIALFVELIAETLNNTTFVDRIRELLERYEGFPAVFVEVILNSIDLDDTDLAANADLEIALGEARATGDEELVTALLLIRAVAEGKVTSEESEKLQGLAPEVIVGVLTGQIDIADAPTTPLPTEMLELVQDRLKDDFRGVTEGDLNRVDAVFEDADGWQVDWILAQMSDEEVETLIAEVESSGFWSDDWNETKRKEFFVMMGEKVSYQSWMTLGEHTERINPDPSTALPDSARDDPGDVAKYSRMRYVIFDGPIAVGDPTYPGNLYPPDHPFGLDDMRQGAIGDCYFLAGMIALADQDPGALSNLISPNPNGSFTVTFADGSQQVVTPDFPVDPDRTDGRPAFANPGPGAQGGELWFMILEKAYAQKEGGWGPIVGGNQRYAIEELTGRDSNWIDNDDATLANLQERFERGEILGLNTIDRPDDVEHEDWLDDPDTPDAFKPTTAADGTVTEARLYQNHAFVVVGVDADAGTISVINPWFPDMVPVELTEAELIESVTGVEQNDAAE